MERFTSISFKVYEVDCVELADHDLLLSVSGLDMTDRPQSRSCPSSHKGARGLLLDA